MKLSKVRDGEQPPLPGAPLATANFHIRVCKIVRVLYFKALVFRLWLRPLFTSISEETEQEA